MPSTCPTCGCLVVNCARCGGSLLGSRWASLPARGPHAHVHARCLGTAEVPAEPAALTALFADWDASRVPAHRRTEPEAAVDHASSLVTVRCRILEPVAFGPCGLCEQGRRLYASLRWDDQQLAACRECYEAAYQLGRLMGDIPVRFELEPPT